MTSRGVPSVSVCTTSYNNAHSLEAHFLSVMGALEGFLVEYNVVDNKSSDGTFSILSALASAFPNVNIISRRCSRGTGRQIAASVARCSTILWVDTDTVYLPRLGELTRRYLQEFSGKGLALQAMYAGLYPRELWFRVGGTRNLNYAEDLDLWIRIWTLGKMRWTPVLMGENLKPSQYQDAEDITYHRYPKSERLRRLARREIDLWRLRKYYRMDLEAIWKSCMVDLDLGDLQKQWIGDRQSWSPRSSARRVKRDLKRILESED
ncbi:MAG TPA: glycosyltransferase [Candidatus Bathyarchaeia archaeon]|nr:glycosyltransferase [Candidatus Bathyarchaeia archaeon]